MWCSVYKIWSLYVGLNLPENLPKGWLKPANKAKNDEIVNNRMYYNRATSQ